MRKFLRSDRLSSEMAKEISKIIRDDIKDSNLNVRGGMISVVNVLLSKDIRNATVSISVLGSENDRKRVIDALERASKFVKKTISERMRMRVTPEIRFRLDDSIEYSARLDKILKNLKDNNEISE